VSAGGHEKQENESEPEGLPRFLGGYFLISEFDLADPNFHRSVVLMIAHDADGAFGLVVNRPSRFALGEVIEGVEDTPAAAIPVYVGGPVQQNALFVMHESPGAGTAGVKHPLPGVTFEPATTALLEYLKGEWAALPETERPAVRMYVGYSGWGPGQLEGELKVSSWVVLKASKQVVFDPDPQAVWEQALAKKGPLYQIILQTGFKPSLN
jgi:putative transcriptional regulator